MNAWSGDPVPARYISWHDRTRAAGRAGVSELSSAVTVTHWAKPVDKEGQHWTACAVRLTQDQLIRQVIQGGGNMPAYGNNLSPGGKLLRS